MWNLKRVLILVFGLAGSLVGYSVYALFLGGIDSLQPLPDDMKKQIVEIELPPPDQVDQKLAQSFGPNCEELRRPLRLWIADKGIAFSAGDFKLEKDGRVKLAPFSAAMYHKAKLPGAYPEISTIRCDIAYVTLDRPAYAYTELNNREVIGVEMIGKSPGITMTNNRRTAEKSDDVDILISNGNLLYSKEKNLIWTDGVVCVRDFQAKPPTEIRGKGMQMELAKALAQPKARSSAKVQSPQPANDNGNIEKIRLQADVAMHFWVDAKSGFLGGVPNERTPAPQPSGNKAQIHIKTGGPFVYDLVKEMCWFESPPLRESSDSQPIAPDQLHVERHQLVNGKPKFDQLICDRLELQFRSRGAGDAPTGGDKDIETAKATRRDRNEVVLSLDSEQMAAYGTELFYRAGDLNNGPMTILKGEPLKTVKDGHKMVCQELRLYAANRAGDGQKAEAKGKGQIDLIDTKTNPAKPSWPTHVLWDKSLTVLKEKIGGKTFDLMTVNGDASFIDDQQKQELHGETIMVWIEQLQEAANKQQAAGSQRQELRRVLAIENVRASSPDFVIRKANRLNMIFENRMPEGERLPDNIVAARVPDRPMDNPPAPAPAPTPSANVIVEQKKPIEEKKAAPIEVSGIEITGTVYTLGAKKELQDLIVKGNVRVFQPGDTPSEKRMDITGELLTVKYADKDAHILTVHGDKQALAKLEMGEMTIWGPIVTIDQATNKANVAGHGAVRMPSNKNLDGSDAPKDRKASHTTIYWNKSMDFDGRTANFRGGVQGFQQDSYTKMQCENLMVYTDKFVSFKQGQKKDESAKIDRLICDKNLFIDDSQVDDKKLLVQRNVLVGRELSMDNVSGGTNVPGPGEVRLLAKGNSTLEIAAPGAEAKAAPVRTEWKLTHVKFRDRMFSNVKASVKNAKFYGYNSGVEVFHFATTDINAKMNPDRPAKDQLYLRCGILEVEGRQSGQRTTQYMIARENVEFRTDKYMGYADIVTYNEETEIITFEGINDNRVRLYQLINNELRPASVTTSKVLYNRKTGTLESAGVKSITN